MLVVRRLIWDAWNIAHIARHDVTSGEAEEVCHSNPITLASYSGRIIAVGATRANRMLAVVLEPVGEDV